jgi:sodium pump decarboxylase gamma subunit
MSKLWFGLQVAVLGMGIVFVALIILSYLTSLLSRIASGKDQPTVIKDETAGGKKDLKTPVNTKSDLVEQEGDVITPELMAVITAAVHEWLGTTKYRITAIRKICKEKTPLWAQAGRTEQMKNLVYDREMSK